jgi:hypothetical protein
MLKPTTTWAPAPIRCLVDPVNCKCGSLFIARRCRSAATLKRSKRFPRQSSWYQSTLGRILIWVLPCAFGPLRPFAPPPLPPTTPLRAFEVDRVNFWFRYSLREYAAAVDVFERLLEFQPDNLGHYTNLGRLARAAHARCVFCSFENFPAVLS